MFLSVWHGENDDDGFNALGQTAGLRVGEIAILRAYGRYLQQAGIPQSQTSWPMSLNRYPDIARLLFELFTVRLDPAKAGKSGDREAEIEAAVLAALDEVPNLDDDTIFRRFLNLIKSTLRTNRYMSGNGHGGQVAGAEAGFAAPSTACRNRDRGARSSSTAPRSRACTCASGRWRAAGCAGPTGPRTTAPRCWGWSRRSRSRTPSSCRSAPRAASSRGRCRPAAAATRSSRPATRPTSTSSPACCR